MKGYINKPFGLMNKVFFLNCFIFRSLSSFNLVNLKSEEKVSEDGEMPNDSSINLTMHLISGCIRCLAVGTKHSMSLRYAIGDNKCRVRRLARFIRVRLPHTNKTSDRKTKGCFSVPSPPRYESLAGNVCLVLQNCVSDTPLAEHLQETSVIHDLLSLIQVGLFNTFPVGFKPLFYFFGNLKFTCLD